MNPPRAPAVVRTPATSVRSADQRSIRPPAARPLALSRLVGSTVTLRLPRRRDPRVILPPVSPSAVKLALTGEVDAIVTAPAHKHALHLAGFPYPGHTEWLAKLAGDVDVAMMLASAELRVVLVTTHVPFRDVPALLTVDRVTRIGRITANGLREWFGIASPRLAVCAVNPHAGEHGLFGDEEERVLRPAAEALGAAGPLPADTVFVRALRGEFDAVLAPYHDVGMTAIKVAAFGRAVNVTLGLPFPRTSPDHGTALDIAGTGQADASSMRAAIELACRLGSGARLAPAAPSGRDTRPA